MNKTKVPPDIPCRTPETQHRWQMVMHVDGCHFYGSRYFCAECRARFTVTLERDIRDDPYSAVWMADEGGPEDERCARCAELMDGAEPVEPAVIVERATA